MEMYRFSISHFLFLKKWRLRDEGHEGRTPNEANSFEVEDISDSDLSLTITCRGEFFF